MAVVNRIRNVCVIEQNITHFVIKVNMAMFKTEQVRHADVGQPGTSLVSNPSGERVEGDT